MFHVTPEWYDPFYERVDPIVLIDYDDERFSLFTDYRNESLGYTVLRRYCVLDDEEEYSYFGTFTTLAGACEEIFRTVKFLSDDLYRL